MVVGIVRERGEGVGALVWLFQVKKRKVHLNIKVCLGVLRTVKKILRDVE